MQKRAFFLVVGLLALGVLGMTIAMSLPPPNGGHASEASAQGGEAVKLGSRSSKAPKEWIKEPPSNKLRLGQFRVPKVEGDDKDGEIALFHFPGGGSVKENVDRWKAKFKTQPPPLIKEDQFKVNGVDVTYLDIIGTYSFQTPAPLPDYRMIAIYFDSDDGPFFATFIGPKNTVAHHKKGFDDWLKAFK